MPGLRNVVGLTSATLLALACSPALKLSKEPFQNTGLHRVEQPGRGELFVSPHVDEVRTRIRDCEKVALRCGVIVRPEIDSPALADARRALTHELCGAVERDLETRPRPQPGNATAPPAQVTRTPAASEAVLEALLINVEGDATHLAPAPESLLRVRLLDANAAKPVLQFFYDARSAAREPLPELVSTALERLYTRYDTLLDSTGGGIDVASPPR